MKSTSCYHEEKSSLEEYDQHFGFLTSNDKARNVRTRNFN